MDTIAQLTLFVAGMACGMLLLSLVEAGGEAWRRTRTKTPEAEEEVTSGR